MNPAGHLPKRMVRAGCTPTTIKNGDMTKFVLENKNREYRGFIDIRVDDRKREARLYDLYSDFYYRTGLMKVENT